MPFNLICNMTISENKHCFDFWPLIYTVLCSILICAMEILSYSIFEGQCLLKAKYTISPTNSLRETHILIRRIPEAIYRVHTLEGVWEYSPYMGPGVKPFLSIHRAKMSYQDTQLNMISCIFLPKSGQIAKIPILAAQSCTGMRICVHVHVGTPLLIKCFTSQ